MLDDLVQNRYLLALYHLAPVGSQLINRLVCHFPNLQELFKLSVRQLEQLNLPIKIINGIRNPPWQLVDKDLKWQQQTGHYILLRGESGYPELLSEIVPPPLLLFILGDPKILLNPQLAIVGSRAATPIGLENAGYFAYELAKLGLTITSGLALGVDAAAHRGTLKAQGKTIAVIGNGIDDIYPKQNQRLAAEIVAQGGAVVSEFPLTTSPHAENFPQRNRIISGLSYGTLVVEASARSGSLITARLALEQNREVFAIPGTLSNSLARGTNGLIRQGAKLVADVIDIVQELSGVLEQNGLDICIDDLNGGARCNAKKVLLQKSSVIAKLTREQKFLLKCLEVTPIAFDVLVGRSDMSSREVMQIVTELEILGVAQRHGAMVSRSF